MGAFPKLDSGQRIRVMVVDDTIAFRSQIKMVLDQVDEIRVVATAANGKIALAKLENQPIDLVILDLEMPEMDGLETLQEMQRRGYMGRVIIFSAQNIRGADQTLRALESGAADFVLKPSKVDSLNEALEQVRRELVPKILQFVRRRTNSIGFESGAKAPERLARSGLAAAHFRRLDLMLFRPRLIVVASSTGGPQALEILFSNCPAVLRVPIVIAQHMPPVFTKSLAARIGNVSGVETSEIAHNEILQPKIYVVPGDYHMRLAQDGEHFLAQLDQGPKRNSVRPAADILFESAAQVVGEKLLGFVLTGMGQDGADGAVAIKDAGGGIMIQDEDSSVVWGMPGAVAQRAALDQMGDLVECATVLRRVVS